MARLSAGPDAPIIGLEGLSMDSTLFLLSLVFGTIGMGMFMYGKKASRMVPLFAGGGLMVVPYFIPSAILMLLVCTGLTALPWIIREG